MYKRLSDEQLNALIEAGISEFADKGFDRASLSSIAKKSGISVGVIYKYYDDKEAFFLACVRDCLKVLETKLDEVSVGQSNVSDTVNSLIALLIQHAKEKKDINRMYHEVTSCGNKQFAQMLAQEIEGMSAQIYKNTIEKAQKAGLCRKDADPELFAFFFDNLFMMLQFSYCCDYYRERLKLYCGEEIFEDDERMTSTLSKFLLGALGI